MPFYLDEGGILRSQELDQWPWLAHGFSTRRSGDLSEPQKRQVFSERVGGEAMKVLTVRQIHSAIARLVDRKTPAGLAGDSLLTSEPGLLLGIKTADCLPILLVDARQRAVAAVHAGWRGLARRVVEKSAGEMRRVFGSAPGDLHAAIGPGILACCFEVGPEVLEEFESQFVDAARYCRRDPPNPALVMIPKQVMRGGVGLMRDLESDRGRVDLAEAARAQLLAAGLASGQIYNSGLCTACDLQQFYSYRREKDAAGRLMAAIGVRGERDCAG